MTRNDTKDNQYTIAFTLQPFNDNSFVLVEAFIPDNNFSFCFVSYLLNVPVHNFSVMSGWSHHFLGITSTLGSKYVLLMDTTGQW